MRISSWMNEEQAQKLTSYREDYIFKTGRNDTAISKETAIRFLRELRTNEKAKELLQGRERPKNKDDAIKAYAEVAKELGEDISAEDITQALEEIEAEIHQKTKAVSADMVELEDDDLEDVAGGMEPCGPLVRFIKIIQKNKEH